MSAAKKVCKTILSVLLWILLIFALGITAMVFISQQNDGIPSVMGKMPFSIITDSMEPTLMVGDLIISEKVENANTLEVGDIITFWMTKDNTRVPNTHRIVAVEGGEGSVVRYQTKGDNPAATEDESKVFPVDIIGVYKGTKISGLGSAMSFLQTSQGFLICIVLPLLLFFLYELYRFVVLLVITKNASVKAELTEEQKKAAVAEYLAQQKSQEAAASQNNNENKQE